ncbi:NlpC/P60 family protein [Streptomyces sp. WMMB 322]|uniref:NlpC/P60 family protein n=1 Tax=Streptomyces sp. WMMB 322 TaxID=1286821 RepID=UPI0008239B35|nr:NlpC/P60 family protein [Streptomyces sp. WMMB 322]SCK31023.1 NlpC/P60 family protein [Streptomyces sp. WMMB 322]
MNRRTRIVLPVVAGAAVLASLTPMAVAGETPAGSAAGTQARETKAEAGTQASISRNTVIKRARTWLTAIDGHQVPYSQSKTFRGYRTDCSGYVSMALKYGKPGTNTVGLASSQFTKKIKMSQLKKGDLIIDANGSSTTRHVVIFEKWTSAAHKSYRAYEQRGGYGTDHSTRSYGIGKDQYDAYRPKKY